MKLFIEALNRRFPENGHFCFLEKTLDNNQFPAYKTYEIKVSHTKNKALTYSYKETGRGIDDAQLSKLKDDVKIKIFELIIDDLQRISEFLRGTSIK